MYIGIIDKIAVKQRTRCTSVFRNSSPPFEKRRLNSLVISIGQNISLFQSLFMGQNINVLFYEIEWCNHSLSMAIMISAYKAVSSHHRGP